MKNLHWFLHSVVIRVLLMFHFLDAIKLVNFFFFSAYSSKELISTVGVF